MNLSRTTLKDISAEKVNVPAQSIFNLPEKVLQFGTGVLLRGLPDYYIDKANKQGIFNGRVVIVKSTSAGGTDAFQQQDGLFTHCIRGIENGKKVEENILNSSVSRVISANENWEQVLECAGNPDLEIIVSNTTEVGINLKADDNIQSSPPVSFPGKLLSFLYKRFQLFNGDASKGVVIIPTELIIDNGKKLEAIVLELAHLNSVDPLFMDWLENHNHFCSSLVDRIVPGKLSIAEKERVETELGYKDDLMIMSESYSLWAIEACHPTVKEKLTFTKADSGVVIADDISKFRELKLRLLNGTHTFSCGLAFLAGFTTVKEALENEDMAAYVKQLMTGEIAPAIPYQIEEADAIDFCNKVMDRFRNSFIEHKWLAITVQYSSKMRLRNVPLLLEHYKKSTDVPKLMALGFAAHILFMKCEAEEGKFYGTFNGSKYEAQDDNADLYAGYWNQSEGQQVVNQVLADSSLWGESLNDLPGFAEAVAHHLQALQSREVIEIIKEAQFEKQLVN
ncbi:MAG TPA: tagaturonate reductase [Segetibacter sp.]|jgi:tagaturonate reductase